jgi:PAS domain S-box-containing protein
MSDEIETAMDQSVSKGLGAVDHQSNLALEKQAAAERTLRLLTKRQSGLQTVAEILSLVRSFTAFETAVVRVLKDGHFSYLVSQGVPSEFVMTENHLCAHDIKGRLIRDESGAVVCQCVCQEIMNGAVNAVLPFFTEGGSLWTNNASGACSTPDQPESQPLPQSENSDTVYESIVIVPLRTDEDTVGLLQLSDKRKGLAARDLISLVETVGAGIAAAIRQDRLEQARSDRRAQTGRRGAERYAELIESTETLNRRVLELEAAQADFEKTAATLRQSLAARSAQLQETHESLVWEIAEKESLERVLRATEERFRTIFEDSPVGIQVYDKKGALLHTNHACLEIFGVGETGDLSELNLLSHPDLPQEEKGKLAGGLIARCELCFDFERSRMFKTFKAGRIHLDLLIKPIRGMHAGNERGFVVHLQDITERKRAEESLRLSEYRFREIYENSAIMMHSINKGGHFLSVNKKWLEVLGHDRKEVIGRKIEMVMTPESAHRARTSILPKFWQEGKVSDVAYQYMKKDGTIIDVLLDSVVMRDPVWGPVSLSVIRNVTDQALAEKALMQSEERFRAIFEGAKDCIYIKNRSLQYTHVNPALAKVFGISASSLVGKRDEDLYGDEAGKHIREVDARVLSGESIEEENTRPINGVDFTFHDVRIPLKNSRNEITGICGFSRNVTERKKSDGPAVTTAVNYPSRTMNDTFSRAASAASVDSIVLLLGESGSGKDFLARWIHDHSKRARGPFFAINCAAVPHELAESELFGHEAGAFTGAKGRKRGLLELAEGGTLLLNEIGELSLPLQSKLLTFLDTRTFPRVGGEKAIRVNARLIAATHRNLDEEVSKGRFLQALLYRLNVLTIKIPPLRDRLEDIPALVAQMMARLETEMQLPELPTLDSHAMTSLCSYNWPGNVRELRNVLERALMLSQRGKLQLSLSQEDIPSEEWSCKVSFPQDKGLNTITEDLAYALCQEALRRTNGNKRSAAGLLKISRDSLYRYLKRSAI